MLKSFQKPIQAVFLCLVTVGLLGSLPVRAMAVQTQQEETAPCDAEQEPSQQAEILPPMRRPDLSQALPENPGNMGYLRVDTDFPDGFSGSICLSLRNQATGETDTMHLKPGYHYTWPLPESTYAIADVCIENCDHFFVEFDAADIFVAPETEASIMLHVLSDGTVEAALSNKQSEYAARPQVPYADELAIWNYLIDLTGNSQGAAGIMGNLYAESGLSSTNLQNTYEALLGYDDDTYTQAVDSGSYLNFVSDSAGYGLAQWTYSGRKEKLLSFVQSQGKSVGDLHMQLDFLAKELAEGGLLKAFCAVSTVEKASEIMLTNFLAPQDQSDEIKDYRLKLCKYYFRKFCPEESAAQLVQGQLDVIYSALHSSEYIPASSCGQQWAALVCEAAAFPLDTSCCAYHSALRNGVSNDWSIIPPGAAVYGYSGGPYGHVGIYVGNGQVYHNTGIVQTDTLEDWICTYQGFCWGWESGIDLSQVP